MIDRILDNVCKGKTLGCDEGSLDCISEGFEDNEGVVDGISEGFDEDEGVVDRLSNGICKTIILLVLLKDQWMACARVLMKMKVW